MIEGVFNSDNGTLQWQGVTYKIKGFIDTTKYNKLDVINDLAETFYARWGRNAIVYTSKGIWDNIEDNAGLKDNVCEKTTLFLAWWGAITPDYAKPEDVRKYLPVGWYGFELWNDAAGHYKLMSGDSLEKLLSYCYVAEDEEEDIADTTPSGYTHIVNHLVCPPLWKASVLMIEVCPICKGSGMSLIITKANGINVHFGDGEDEYQVCWMCGGKGQIEKIISNKNNLVSKYWMIEQQS